MLKIVYINGTIDGTLPLDPARLTGDLNIDRASDYVRQFESGKFVSFGADGMAKLAIDGDYGIGPLVLDAFGQELENVPALASGKMGFLIGGGVVETDMVVEGNIVAGDKLYLGTGVSAGYLTTVVGNGPVVAVARTANSTADKTVRVQVL